jgi:hypothetical protein
MPWTSAFVNNDMSEENARTEIKTVAEIQARVIGIQRSKKTGIMRMPTVSRTMSNFAMAATLDTEY